jgi:hypothetical protein
VTTINTVSEPANNGHSAWTWPGNTTFSGSPGYVTNVAVIQLPLGTNSATTNVHAILEIPPTSESPDSGLGQQRLYNEAKIILLVSNSTATVRIQTSVNGQLPADDLSPTILTYSTTNSAQLATNLPFLSVTNTFTDQRESDSVLVTQIDVGKFTNWTANNSSVLAKFPANSGTYPNLLYVADNRTYNTSSQLTAVRLTNGVALPSNGGTGFTVATPNPLYVWGNYNCPNSSYLGTTNTSASVPAALLSDALTVLSPSWKDNQSAGSYTSRNPSSMTLNAAILTGIVPSTGTGSSQFSGGVHNLPRLLENWSTSTTLTLNTSIVNLYNSQMATHMFVNPGTYYNPPNRNFSFDVNLADASKQPPPGTPNLAVMLRSSWAVPPPNTINYNVTP